MKDRSDDPSHHERTLLPRSYISLRDRERENNMEGPKKIHVKIKFKISPYFKFKYSTIILLFKHNIKLLINVKPVCVYRTRIHF